MRFALIADIHSNAEAFTAVLEHARLRAVGQFVLLGDLVGYGADPQAVVDQAIQLVGQGALAVLGNHDAAVAGREGGSMNTDAARAIAWTRARLTPAQLRFLSELPLVEQHGAATFVHASAHMPQAWIYVTQSALARSSIDAAGTPYVFSGHVHDPFLYCSGRDGAMLGFRPTENIPIPVLPHRSWLAIVGSAGQPRDNHVGARYAIFDDQAATLTLFRVPYDYHKAAERIRAAGLPAAFAWRIEGLD